MGRHLVKVTVSAAGVAASGAGAPAVILALTAGGAILLVGYGVSKSFGAR